VGLSAFFKNIERIHIGTQADRFTRVIFLTADGGDDAGFGNALLERDSPFGKFLRDEGRGKFLLVLCLRVLVQFTTPYGGFVFQNGHNEFSFIK